MDQYQFVAAIQKTEDYDPDETWENAHFPLPKGMGDETIKLHPYDHVIQGLFQTREFERKCLYEWSTRFVLYDTPGYFPPGWFEACDIYEDFVKQSRSTAGKRSAVVNKQRYEQIRPLAAEARKVSVILTKIATGEEFEFESQTEAANHFQLNSGCLRMTMNGTRKQHKGFKMRKK